MSYALEFLPSAEKEWNDLDASIQEMFINKLDKVLENPHVPKNRLSGYNGNRYKIKLRTIGYRLVYEVEDATVTVQVVGVGRRDTIYKRR